MCVYVCVCVYIYLYVCVCITLYSFSLLLPTYEDNKINRRASMWVYFFLHSFNKYLLNGYYVPSIILGT